MKIIGRKGVSGILSILFLLLLIAGAVIYATIPFWLKGYLDWRKVESVQYYYDMLLLLYLAGIPAMAILWQSWRLMRNVNKGKAFLRENARYLFWIGVSSAVISLLFIIFIPHILSIFSVVIVIIFILLSLIGFVLSELFTIAVRYKEENELTI